MGASGWHYFVLYQPDIELALHQLRKKVFADGDYYRPADFYTRLLNDMGDQFESEVTDGLKKTIEEYKSKPEPQTINDLIELNAEAGTHSIIDMHDIGKEPDFGVVSPLPEDLMIEVLGTSQPNHIIVENKMGELGMRIKACHYFIIFEDDTPSEICFIGYSGD